MFRIVRLTHALCAVVALFITCGTPAVAGDPLVALGQKLFFDPRLSGSGRTSCASCHDPRYGYAQPRRAAIGDNGQIGRRNVPSLVDVRFLQTLMWDGRFPTLEHQAFGPFASGEMGNPIHHAAQRLSTIPEYVDLFGAAFNERPTPDNIARAISAYERTIVSRDSRVDRFLLNNEIGILSPQERHGFEVFTRRAKCVNCHQIFPADAAGLRRPLFTDFRYHNGGIGQRPGGPADVGRYEQSRNPSEWGAFRTPSLRNSVRTPPYMHDGSIATLEEVVEFYSAGGQPNAYLSPAIQPLFLSGEEKAALVAFLRALAE
jgi:cytochrome c peroxidase